MKAIALAAAMHLFAAHHVTGAIAVRDVATGDLLVASSQERLPPLSTVKLLLAALAWDHRVASPVDVHALIVTGSDADGRQLALALRRRLGSAVVLGALARSGFGFALSATSSDAQWADTLSLGERGVRVTLPQLTAFLRVIGGGGAPLASAETARALKDAMRDCVARGTAKGSDAALPPGWRMGGKTGSGPHATLPVTDGIFAGLIFDRQGRARYAVATYVRKGGRGGGLAAAISAETARELIERK